MPADWGRGLARYLPALAQAGLLTLALAAGAGRVGWLLCLGAIALIGVHAWLRSLRHTRAILDTPTSRIASAAQGFVEIAGVGRPLPGMEVRSPARHLPCLWYRYRRYARRDTKWFLEDSGESEAEFLIDDGSGLCMLRPYDAEVVSDRVDTYIENDVRHVEETLLAGESIHALGRFVSRGGHVEFDARRELDQVLTEWKADQATLGDRFDSDGDGKLDSVEWSTALTAAQREVEDRRAEARGTPAMHSLEKPRDGRPYLIANCATEGVARRFRYWAWAYAATALTALVGLAFVPA